MPFEPNPKQALFLWKMILAEDPVLREPPKGKATPALDPKRERQPLIDNGFLETEKRGRAEHLLLTDRAWDWAAGASGVALVRSNSRDGVIALEGLLRRLLPFLSARDVALAELFRPPSPEHSEGPTCVSSSEDDLEGRVRWACRELTAGRNQEPVRLAALRVALADIPKEPLDRALLHLQDGGYLILYRDDNTAALTKEDRRASLLVGNAPRHLLYLKDKP
jgi:hypothetical protein